MNFLSRSQRTRHSHEWCTGKAVTFIVTLAASWSVTLAARAAGMSRKSAYALKDRDPAFAAAWSAALRARSAARRLGDESDTSDKLANSPRQGDRRARRRALRPDAFARDLFFAELTRRRRDSAALAPGASRQ